MAGNNLFSGLNSGNSDKYRKAGEAAELRERAEQLDARIERFSKRNQDYEWAKEALSFVEEERRLNSDVFSLSANAPRLKDIETKANFLLEKKAKEEKKALQRRIERFESLIDEIDKAPRSLSWAEEALSRLEEEEKKNLDILKSLKNASKISKIKAEAERLVEKNMLAEEEAAKEKEKKRVEEAAEDMDKVILDLSKGSRSAYWVDDVNSASALAKKLELKARAKCKNLNLLSELMDEAKLVVEAGKKDEEIAKLSEECKLSPANYRKVYSFKTKMDDSLFPYMKRTKEYSSLLKKMEEYFQKEAEEQAKEDELDNLAVQYEKKLDDFIASAQTDSSKYQGTDAFLSSIPSEVLPRIDETKILKLKKAYEAYAKEQMKLKKRAETEEKGILNLIARYNGGEVDPHEVIRAYYWSLDKTYTPYISSATMDSFKAACEEARDRLEKEAAIEGKKMRRSANFTSAVNIVLPILISLLIVGAGLVFAALEPAGKEWAITLACAMLTFWSFLMSLGVLSNAYGVAIPFVANILLSIASLPVLALTWGEGALTPGLIFIGYEVVLLIARNFICQRRAITRTFIAVVVGAIAGVVWAFVLNLIQQGGMPSADTVVLCVGIFAVVLYAALVFFLEFKHFGKENNTALSIVVHSINFILAVVSIIFMAIGKECALISVFCVSGFFAAELICCTVGRKKNNLVFASFALAVSIVLFSITLGLTYFEGWGRGLMIGLPCLVSFLPFCIISFRKLREDQSSYGSVPTPYKFCGFCLPMGIAFGVMAIVGGVNYPGYMALLNVAFLFNAWLFTISLFVMEGLYEWDAAITVLGAIVAIFLLVATPISIVQMIGHVEAMKEESSLLFSFPGVEGLLFK